jgi:hypothetical protein
MKGFAKLILLFMFLIPADLSAQVSFGIFGGLGTYKMDKLKEINRMQAESLPIETVKVNNFNPGIYIGASANLEISRSFSVGLNYHFNSTGSRIGQKDYSGFYAFDQIVNGHFLGLEAVTFIEENKFLTASLSMISGACFTHLEMRETISVSEQRHEDSELFTATSFYLYPNVKFCIPVYKIISVNFALGLLYDSGGKIHLKGNKNAVLGLNESPVKTGWTGLRVTTGLRFDFR